MEIVSERYNPLIGRKELVVRVTSSETPRRYALRQEVARLLSVDLGLVYVRKIRSLTGRHEVVAEVHVYDDPGRALRIEPEHIRLRNQPPGEKRGKGAGG
ncbi:TPA: 30S ribosomal protein S24e [Candidatus Bathyarchaeota archaeon]|nr:30S ribosomal protein S24e [Candidatus Bathyarchaeota archaeon]